MRFVYTLVDDNQDAFVRKHSDEMLQLHFCGPLLILWHVFIAELKEQLSLQRAEFRLLVLRMKRHSHNYYARCIEFTSPIHAIPSLNR